MNNIAARKNAKRNLIYGFFNKLVILVLPFVTRTTINIVFGYNYLGLSSLFSSIISVLSLAEMGMGGAIVYHLYKPIAEDDCKTINAILAVYKKAYLVIGAFITALGLLLLPFLRLFIKGDVPLEINIYVIFIFQLIDTVIGYFLFAYKQSLLAAYQREDILSIINLCVKLGLNIVQVLVMYLTRNYYFYILCSPVFTIIGNLWTAYITDKMFPECHPQGRVEETVLLNIRKLTIGSFVQKACGLTRNSLDSIFVSMYLGLTITAFYNNYYYIFSGVTLFLGVIVSAITGGVGNHVVVKSIEENFKELRSIDSLYLLLSGWSCTMLLCLIQPFMRIWMGEESLLGYSSVILFCTYFYSMKMGDMKSNYNTANGLWWEQRFRSIAETIINIVLNIVLGKLYGINGIILATVISLVSCNFVWGSIILFENYFGKALLREYYFYQFKFLVINTIVCTLSFLLCKRITLNNVWLELLAKGTICFFVPGLVYLLTLKKDKYIRNTINLLLKRE